MLCPLATDNIRAIMNGIVNSDCVIAEMLFIDSMEGSSIYTGSDHLMFFYFLY